MIIIAHELNDDWDEPTNLRKLISQAKGQSRTQRAQVGPRSLAKFESHTYLDFSGSNLVSRKTFRRTSIVSPSSPEATVNHSGMKPNSPRAPRISLMATEAAMFCLAIFTVLLLSLIMYGI